MSFGKKIGRHLVATGQTPGDLGGVFGDIINPITWTPPVVPQVEERWPQLGVNAAILRQPYWSVPFWTRNYYWNRLFR